MFTKSSDQNPESLVKRLNKAESQISELKRELILVVQLLHDIDAHDLQGDVRLYDSRARLQKMQTKRIRPAKEFGV